MKFRYNVTNIGPVPLIDLSSSITAGPAGIQFVNIVAQNQTITFGPTQIELQDSDEVIKSFTSGQLKQLVDDGIITVDIAPNGSFEYIPASPPDWQIPPPTTIFEGLDQAADIASSYRDGTALGIKLANGSNIGDASHRVANVFVDSISANTSFNIKVGLASVITADATTTTINEDLVVTGGANVNSLTVGALNGVLRAAAGLVSGSATTDDLPEGFLNIYYTDARGRASQSATTPLSYNSITGDHSLAGLIDFGSADQLVSTNAGATGWEYKTIVGTPNQTGVNIGLGLITVSAAQDIAQISSPTFAGLTIGSLNGILKATAGVVSAGGLTSDDIPEGVTNLYFTDARANSNADARINAQKGLPNGLASLDGTGKVPAGQLPDDIGTGNIFTANSEPAMLGLTAKKGDIAVRNDVNRSYGLATVPATNPSNWLELLAVGTVFSVNGFDSDVILTTDDVNEGPLLTSRKYYTDERVSDHVANLFGNGAGDITWIYDDNLDTMSGLISLATKTTDDLAQGIDPARKYYSDELVSDHMADVLVGGTNVQLAYDDTADTITISVNLTGSVLGEAIDDEVASLIKPGTGLSWTYNDAGNTLTGDVSLAPFTTNNLAEGGTNLYYTSSRVETDVGILLVAGTNVTIVPSPGSLTINASLNVVNFNQMVFDNFDNSPTVSWAFNGIDSITAAVSLATFDTDDLAESLSLSGNKYFTDARVDTRVLNLLVAGSNITLTPAGVPGTGTLTISAVFTGPNSFEEVDDRVAGLIQNGTGIVWVYDDIGNNLTGNVTLAPFTTNDLVEGVVNLYYTDERVDDRVSALLVAGNNITLTYNDNGAGPGTITIDALFTGPMSFEDVDDRVASLIQNGTGITWLYNDPSGTLTPTVSLGAFDTTKLPEGTPYFAGPGPTDNYVGGLYYIRTRVENDVTDIFTGANGAGTLARLKGNTHNEISGTLNNILIDIDVLDGTGITWEYNRTNIAAPGPGGLPANSARANVSLTPFTTDNLTEGVINKYQNVAALAEIIDDRVAALLVPGPGISLNYDDTGNTLTVTSFLAAYSDEQAQDAVASMIQPSANAAITWLYSDSLNKLTPTFHMNVFTTDDLPQGTTNLYMSIENVDDRVAALILNGVGLNWTYVDGAGSLTGNVTLAPFTTDDLAEGSSPTRQYFTNERVDDRVAVLIQDGPGITWFYDDTNNELTPTVSLGGFTTDDITEGTTNKFYTDARARASQSATTPLSYNSATGVHSLAGLSSLGTANQFVSVNAGATAWEYKTLSGTANQVVATFGVNSIVLSLPQDINTTSTPTFTQVHLGSPAVADNAATKSYVDAVASGLDVKGSVRAATTANITLSAPQTIDGVSLIAGDRVLVKNQTTATENGIYAVAAGAWVRSTDADNSPAGEVTAGMFAFVEEGTLYKGQGFVLTTANPITLGTTSLAFTQFSGAGGGGGASDSSTLVNVSTTPYSALTTDGVIMVDASSIAVSTFAVTLPTASGVSGKKYTIKKTDSTARTVKVVTTSGQTIDGAVDYTLTDTNQFAVFISDGTNWKIIGW